MNGKRKTQAISRRSVLKQGGMAGAVGLGTSCVDESADLTSNGVLQTIRQQVNETPIVDTHEHLIEEESRLSGKHERIEADDWSFLLGHYLNSDLVSCGMPQDQYDAFFSAEVGPEEKWQILEPYWPRVSRTGYGQAVSIAVERLYGVSELSAETIPKIQDAYRKNIRPGFYRRLLNELGNIESCQVNSLETPFKESKQPDLLMR